MPPLDPDLLERLAPLLWLPDLEPLDRCGLEDLEVEDCEGLELEDVEVLVLGFDELLLPER